MADAAERRAQAAIRSAEQQAGLPPATPDAEPLDWAERWGRLIGRSLGLLVTAALLAWLAFQLAGR